MLQSHRGVSYSAARSNPGGQPFSGTSMLELEFAQLSDPGKVRDHNEDFIGYAEPGTPAQTRSHGWLFVLADGLGGHDRGEVASQLAVDTLVSSFYASPVGEAGARHSATAGAVRKCENLRLCGRRRPRRQFHGHHAGGVPSPPRPRYRGPRGRLALLSDSPRPRHRVDPRSHPRPRAGAHGDPLGRRSEDLRESVTNSADQSAPTWS